MKCPLCDDQEYMKNLGRLLTSPRHYTRTYFCINCREFFTVTREGVRKPAPRDAPVFQVDSKPKISISEMFGGELDV